MSLEINVNFNKLQKDPSSLALVNLIQENQDALRLSEAILYYEFPFYWDDNNSIIAADVLIVSKPHGVIIFKCEDYNARTLDEQKAKTLNEGIDQVYSQIYSKLIKSRGLRIKPQQLAIDLHPALFLPNYDGSKSTFTDAWPDLEVILNSNELTQFLSGALRTPINDSIFKETLATLEGSKGLLRPPKGRGIAEETKDSKGALLDKIETEIGNFDREQKTAALSIIDKAQRIRGLAGSGKTVVLAMKAAQIHLQEPDAEILFTYYTKNLYPFIKELITRFFRQFVEKDPNWDKIHILHAWGGRNLEGVYYDTCKSIGVSPLTLKDIKEEVGDIRGKKYNAFDEVCKKLLEEHRGKINKIYDYSILDEAQDFPAHFYQLCYEITKAKKIIWGYDECQNIFNIDKQDTKSTFGQDETGNYKIELTEPFQDIVLHKCYRNSRNVLTCAFALGFGIYNDKVLQMLENNDHWQDLGFQVLQGNSRKDDKMLITRPIENSPLSRDVRLESKDIIAVKVFEKMEEECLSVVNGVEKDLESKLLPDDILIISLDDRNARSYFDFISKELAKKSIKSFNLLTAPFSNRDFWMKDHVTLSTVYRAKGNEAGSVYIVGVDSIFLNKDSYQERNKLFTSITRSKCWVTISGMAAGAELCKDEVEKIFKQYPNLAFTMPDRPSLRNIQRDLTEKQIEFNEFLNVLEKTATKMHISKEELVEKLKRADKKK